MSMSSGERYFMELKDDIIIEQYRKKQELKFLNEFLPLAKRHNLDDCILNLYYKIIDEKRIRVVDNNDKDIAFLIKLREKLILIPRRIMNRYD